MATTSRAELLLAVLEPLAWHISPRTLSRISRSSKDAHTSIHADGRLWSAAAAYAGLPAGTHTRQSVVEHYIGTCNFCTDVTFGATVKDGGRRVVLDLGSAEPRTCRVAAAHSIVSLRRFGTVEFTIRQLEHAANHHVVLWLGLLYDKHHGRSIEHSTLREALGAYDVSHPTGGSMRDRFACRPWSMNAVGSSGAVWSDGAVVRLLGQRFGPGDRVRLRLGDDSRSLRVAITHAASGLCSEHLAIRRLVRDLSSAAPPRLHAIVHLSDVAVPTIGSSARAVVEVAA